jgi:hypothetical protein
MAETLSMKARPRRALGQELIYVPTEPQTSVTVVASPSLASKYPAFALGFALAFVTSVCGQDKAQSVALSTGWNKPAWLTDLSLGIKESYDDNLLLVAGKDPGLSPQSSWITTVSPRLGFNFAPLLGKQLIFQTLSLGYAPDFAIYHEASSESYNAHKIANVIKGKTGDFSFSVDNAFLFNDGDTVAPIYALNQGPTIDGQYDALRSAFATAAPRERRKQIQDRAAVVFQYDLGKSFFRPIASLLFYDLMTDWHKASVSPYKGYQNYADRADVNGGLDLGYKVAPNLALTAGYRYGHQYQQAYPHSIDVLTVNGQQAQSSSDYQRLLLGLEGKPWSWLAVKLSGGPDFLDYNPAAPVDDDQAVDYYAEVSLVAAITPSQSLAFTYRHARWVSSTGKIPTVDSVCALTYHWSATRQLGFDLMARYADRDYNVGSTVKTLGASLRNDAMYSLSAGVSYAFTSHLSASLGYACDFGRNEMDFVGPLAGYREFDHQLVSLAAQFKF